MLWNSKELEVITGGHSLKPFSVNGVSIDTRTLQPNDLFVALTVKRDGHDFVLEALKKGASGVLVSKIPEGVSSECPLLLVNEVKRALDLIGIASRARSHAKIVAITGSVGKTSTKEMLKKSLSKHCLVHVSKKSYNNQWGVPLSLANMPENTEVAVFEIGMNSPGEILPLTRMIRPHLAIITAVTTAHLESFCSVDEIAKEKASILEGLEENGLGIVNCDFESLDKALSLYSSVKLITFGKFVEADWRLSNIKFSNTNMICSLTSNIYDFDFKINTLGEHHAINATATLCAAHAIGADLSGAILGLENWKPFKGRGERSLINWKLDRDQSDLELIDESYNASPASVEASLYTLAISKPPAIHGRRVAILGDMLELGQTEKSLHEEIVKHPSLKDINVVHCVGELMNSLFQNLPPGKRGLLTLTAADFLTNLTGVLKPGDVVMVKGSLSMKMNLIVDAIKELGQVVELIDEDSI